MFTDVSKYTCQLLFFRDDFYIVYIIKTWPFGQLSLVYVIHSRSIKRTRSFCRQSGPDIWTYWEEPRIWTNSSNQEVCDIRSADQLKFVVSILYTRLFRHVNIWITFCFFTVFMFSWARGIIRQKCNSIRVGVNTLYKGE